MSKRTDYWKKVSDELMTLAANQAPSNADQSMTYAMAYRALAWSQCSDNGPAPLPDRW